MTYRHSNIMLTIVVVTLLLVVTGCGQPTPTPVSETSSPTPSALLRPSSTPTPTRTPTATPTPTPTPTAPPVTVVGNLRQARLATPQAQGGAPCGVVDLLDFPLDPPEAERAMGGSDFGIYRERYNGIHTGEDWLSPSRSSVPVYSIGHGQVTYAHPRGWGGDGGTVIVRHVFSDGTRLLSFYGHLDPPSVELKIGECVVRGQQVGRIGRRPVPTHLHFEIRTHMPGEPGPGYWSVDPTLAGWRPPSYTIWDSRIATLPGVGWQWPYRSPFRQGLGVVERDSLVIIDEEKPGDEELDDLRLMGINVADGSLGWSRPISDETISALLNPQAGIVYTSDQFGRVQALAMPTATLAGLSPTALWQLDLDVVGIPRLTPLPGGGLALFMYDQLFGFSAQGDLLWQLDPVASPLDWALDEERWALMTADGDLLLWTAGQPRPQAWPLQSGGQPVIGGERLFLYARDGVYELQPETRSARLLYVLPEDWRSLGHMAVLPDGGLLVAHTDRADSRLIALGTDGALRWERSYAHLSDGLLQPRLLALKERVYLLLQNDRPYRGWLGGASSTLNIFVVDMEDGELTHIFAGGTRDLPQEGTWVFAVDDDHLLVSPGAGSIFAFDAQLALDKINP